MNLLDTLLKSTTWDDFKKALEKLSTREKGEVFEYVTFHYLKFGLQLSVTDCNQCVKFSVSSRSEYLIEGFHFNYCPL